MSNLWVAVALKYHPDIEKLVEPDRSTVVCTNSSTPSKLVDSRFSNKELENIVKGKVNIN